MKIFDLGRKRYKETIPLSGDKIFLNWEAKEESNKSFKILFLIFILFSLFFFFFKENYFGSLLCFLVFLIIILLKKEKNYFALSKDGIIINKELYPWKNIESFWIFEEPAEIHVKTRKVFVSNLILPIKKEIIQEAEKVLLRFLPEKKVEISLIDVLRKKLGL